ncbi:MAG: hypothetical protein N2255_01660, partial [Kiritimatiellae bacterium]|nr:hypothetical protein [Kiritimatiellia bacterium]
MRRIWFGVLALSASWLFGLPYFRAPNWPVWTGLVLLTVVLFLKNRIPEGASKWQGMVAALIGLPATILAPWPYRLVPLFFVIGTLLCTVPIPRQWPGRLGSALVTVSVVALTQAVGLLVYKSLTARNHDVATFIARCVELVARLAGLDAVHTGREVAIFTMRKGHQRAGTWGLLLDPVTLCFLAGG